MTSLDTIYDTIWVRSADDSIRTLEQVADKLAGFDVVFFGEYHGHPGNHLAQMRLFQALHARNPDSTLSLEQFERDTQTIVDQYLAGEIGEKSLQEEARGWDNYEQSYRPLVEYAKSQGLPVIASNAPKKIVICVGKKGPEILDELPQPDRSWVAESLHLDEGAYLDKYMSFIMGAASHGPAMADEDGASDEDDAAGHAIPEAMRKMVMRSFAAQVTRDDTMAESIAMHLRDNPGRKVVHLDGNFHSASHLGTVERLQRRMPELAIAVINPIAVDDNKDPGWTSDDAATGDYILLMQAPPEEFVRDDALEKFQREVLSKRMSNKCEYGEDQ